MIVLDASAAIELLLGATRRAPRIVERVREDSVLAAPYLIDAEVGQVLRRFVIGRQLSMEGASAALQDLADLPVTRYPHAPLLSRAFDLRENTTFYDALYLALAEALDSPLLTCDAALASIPGHEARVEVIR